MAIAEIIWQNDRVINAWGGKVKREFDFIIGRTKEVITSILYIVHI